MGIGEEVKEKVEEEERKIIYDIVKELPLVPDQVRGATCSSACIYPRSFQPAGFRCGARRLRASACMLGCCVRGLQRLRVLSAREGVGTRSSQGVNRAAASAATGAPCGALGAQSAHLVYGQNVGAACAALRVRRKATRPFPAGRKRTCALAADASLPLQVAYWWVVHAGPLSCGPDRETVEKGLLEKHKK